MNESRDQFKLLMKRNALDNLNNTLDDILERIVYMKDAANVEVYFGRPAIYRATHGEPTRIFEGVKNVGHFEEYVQQLEHVIKEAKDILKGVSNIEINNEYMNKLKAEVGFSSDYIRPLIEVMKDRFGDTYRELATRLLQQLADIHQKF
ncbi:MAG: hypothetical protein Q7U04_17090 [Bacteriovorax sp.]|nr:hypothetical protein [Bacteriovorax sp.]